MTVLTMLRHGRVVDSAVGTHYGQLDVELSAEGREQSLALARRLVDEPFDAVWSSDLSRARWLAEKLAEARGLDLQTSPAFRERSLGVFQGLTYAEGVATYPDLAAAMKRNPGVDPVPGGENLAALARRVMGAIDELVTANPASRIALACHGGPIRVAVGAVLGVPMENVPRIKLDYCSKTVIEYSDGGSPRLRCVNA